MQTCGNDPPDTLLLLQIKTQGVKLFCEFVIELLVIYGLLRDIASALEVVEVGVVKGMAILVY
jgi:hypothetical protein